MFYYDIDKKKMSLIFTQIYFAVTIDGTQIHQVFNADARTFRDVEVFAGDYFHPAADASYKNFIWHNLPGR